MKRKNVKKKREMKFEIKTKSNCFPLTSFQN